jgi:hypothetical protein
MEHGWRERPVKFDICPRCETFRYRLRDGRVGYYRRPGGDAVGDEPACGRRP